MLPPSDAPHPSSSSDSQPEHRAGFVALVGKPNAGKSSLLNALLGQKLTAVTYKAQTTRHRIHGIYSSERAQIVFSDTPGMMEASYELHRRMITAVRQSLEDADLVLVVVDALRPIDETTDPALYQSLATPARRPEPEPGAPADMAAQAEDLQEEELDPEEEGQDNDEEGDAPAASAPARPDAGPPERWLVINKIDALTDLMAASQLRSRLEGWLAPARTFMISATEGAGVPDLLEQVIAQMPHHPPYYDPEQLSDRNERFFAAELIREKIFLLYREEIPYSSEVVVERFEEGDDLIKIGALIYVERATQRGILIGKGGTGLKKLGTEARLELERFFGKRVYLETHIKVRAGWRNERSTLRSLGYGE